MTMQAYATGPRGNNYGYGTGVIPLEDAREFVGRDTDDAATWTELEQAAWDFDLDEEELRKSGQLWELYIDGDTFKLTRGDI